MKLANIVEIIIPKILRNTASANSKKVLVVSLKDISKSGFTTECGKFKNISDEKYLKHALKQYDILIGRHGTPLSIAIIGELNQPLLADNTFYILRLKNSDDLKNSAIALYMYLKSDKAQDKIKNIVSNVTSYQILNKVDLLELDIVDFRDTKPQIVENFYEEQKLYNELYETSIKIHKLQQFFDVKDTSEDLGICRMCRVTPATHLRIDTWKPFEKGIPMCDSCSKNIMF